MRLLIGQLHGLVAGYIGYPELRVPKIDFSLEPLWNLLQIRSGSGFTMGGSKGSEENTIFLFFLRACVYNKIKNFGTLEPVSLNE